MQKEKIGFLLSTPPEHPNKKTVVSLAQIAVKEGHKVYLYLVDDGVHNINEPDIQDLSKSGVHLFLCAYGAQRREIPTSDKATFCGLVVLSDLVKGCDRFVTFN